jgi:hypothetical protein
LACSLNPPAPGPTFFLNKFCPNVPPKVDPRPIPRCGDNRCFVVESHCHRHKVDPISGAEGGGGEGKGEKCLFVNSLLALIAGDNLIKFIDKMDFSQIFLIYFLIIWNLVAVCCIQLYLAIFKKNDYLKTHSFIWMVCPI